MNKLRQLGIRTPEPVAYAYRGFPFYVAWLITREIKNSCTLAEVSCQDPQRVSRIMDKVIEQIDRLIERRFLHVDLHPGNILVDGDDNIYIIDFDKGHMSSTKREQLYAVYYQRWRRAVVKHRLPEILDDMLLKGTKSQLESSNLVTMSANTYDPSMSISSRLIHSHHINGLPGGCRQRLGPGFPHQSPPPWEPHNLAG